jgi:uncharacterized coiled-coil protein SlyX
MPTTVTTPADVTKIQNQINDIKTTLAAQQATIDGLKTKDTMQDDLVTSLQGDLEAVQSSLADQESKITDIQAKDAQYETIIAGVNTAIQGLQSSISTHDTEISDLQTHDVQQDSTISTVGGQATNANQRVDDVDSRLTILEKKVNTPPPPAPMPNTSKTGLDLPFYSSDMSTAGIAAAQAHPGLPMTFTINPASGPGTTFRSDIQLTINQSNAAGKLPLGYIATHWGDGTKTTAAIKAEVDKYVSLYTGLKGVFWDECASSASVIAFYTDITNYARSRGLNIVHANPGTQIDEQYVALFDIITISEENNILLDENTLKGRTFSNKYPKSKFSYLSYGVASLPSAWVTMACKYVGTMYLTSDSLPNPWDSPSTYLDALLNALEAAAPSA